MRRNYEKLQANIPVGADFTIADIDEKAKELGIERTELVIKAVEIYLNLHDIVINRVNKLAKELQVPEYLILNNLVLENMGINKANIELKGKGYQGSTPFVIVTDELGTRIMTGEELIEFIAQDIINKSK